MVSTMVKELMFMEMEVDMKETMKMDKNMEKEKLTSKMVV